jgi:hypothetical protein
MSEPKTDYKPDSYNRESFANIMQFIFADLMIRFNREGQEAFWETQEEVVKIRKAIEAAYQSQGRKDKNFVAVNRMAEGVLLWMRSGATVDDVVKCSKGKLIQRGRKLGA